MRPARLLTGASAADEGREKAEAEEAIVQCNHVSGACAGVACRLTGYKC